MMNTKAVTIISSLTLGDHVARVSQCALLQVRCPLMNEWPAGVVNFT